MAKAKSAEKFNFEDAMKRLNELVDTMEKGDLSLEDSLKYFEEGMKVTQECQKALKTAEQKVQILIEKNEKLALENYQSDETSSK